MESDTRQQEPPQITCSVCGKKFRNKPELAGRTVKCPCGSPIFVPRVESDDPFADVLEFAEPGPNAALVGLAAGIASTDVHAASKPLGHNLPPQRIGLKPEKRQTNEDVAPPSALRDLILPSILIPVGVALRFYEAMSPVANKAPLEFAPAIGAVMLKLVLSIGLMLGGMFLAVSICEVTFVGKLSRTIYKLIAIAVAPGAIYGILSVTGGEHYGSILGTFVSVGAYGFLFWLLMRLDLKDTSMCVILTWILVTAANYTAYRAEGLMRDSWI